MSRIGSTIGSARTNARTPPKLIPPFQRIAASGTFPIEQTKLRIATAGPTTGPQNLASVGWASRNRDCQKCSGTQAASAPAISRPPTMSIQIAAQSMTKYPAVAVKPSGERRRCHSEPLAWTDMSISAWPSIRPSTPRSACARASSTGPRRRKSRKTSASSTIISGPPTNSPSVNCQPRTRAIRIPSSATRFVEANSKAVAAVKSAPRRKSERASATAAYEHDDDAAPRPHAIPSDRGESSGSRRRISAFDTTACTAPESAKPRISAHRISQNIPNANESACQSSCQTTFGTLLLIKESLPGKASAVDGLIALDGCTFFYTDDTGDVEAPEAKGYFFEDVRHLSRWQLLLDEQPLECLASRPVDYYSARMVCAPPGEQPPVTVRRDRFVTDGAHEDIVVTNHRAEPVEVKLELKFGADFADILETQPGGESGEGENGHELEGTHATVWHRRNGYRRETIVAFSRRDLRLEPHEEWKTCVDVVPVVDGRKRPALLRCESFRKPEPQLPLAMRDWLAGAPDVDRS